MASTARVTRVRNPKYQPDGLKSYAYLLNKYKFTPTKEGPFFVRTSTSPARNGAAKKRKNRLGLLFSRIFKTGAPTKASATQPLTLDQNAGSAKGEYKLLKKTSPVAASGAGAAPATTGSGTGSATDAQTDQVTAQDVQNDSMYLCPVTIGTPGQTLNLDFDTGSSDLWVFSTQLPPNTVPTNGTNHVIFDPTQSTTFQAQSDTWSISYGDGSSASGGTGTDTVTVAGIAISQQVVELAKKLSPQFASGQGDGLLGLAWPAINTVTPTRAATPVANMISQNLISPGLFTAHLGSWRDPATSGEPVSFYTFGVIDQAVLSASNVTEPYYTPVDNSQGFWMFGSASASINGTTVARAGNTAIADTGTTLALVDDATVQAIYAAIPGSSYDASQQGYVFPTSVTPDQLPVVSFAVGDQLFAVPKEALAFAAAPNGTYYGGIQSRGTMTFDILGDTWLKGMYAIFDQQNTRFGAVQRPDPTGTTISVPSGSGQ